jgi:hypothetical protein
MGTKIMITEKQLRMITKLIGESAGNVRLKNQIFNFLKSDYIPSGGVKEIGNEFYNTALIKKKIDGEMISPQSLSDYIGNKFDGLSKSDINDSIEGWFYGDYDTETGLRKKK